VTFLAQTKPKYRHVSKAWKNQGWLFRALETGDSIFSNPWKKRPPAFPILGNLCRVDNGGSRRILRPGGGGWRKNMEIQ